MSSLFTELRRRNVFTVGAAYFIVAWLIAQIIDVVNDPVRGNPDEALMHLQITEQLWADIPPDRIAQLALGYSRLDRNGDVERLVGNFEAKTQENSAGNAQWAMIYLAQGNYEQAYARLEAAVNAPLGEFRLGQIKVNDFGDPILDEPEWQALRDKIGALD